MESKYDGGTADLSGTHKLDIQTDSNEIEGARINTFKDGRKSYSAFGAQKYYNIFYINFHQIKDEISTQRTSWGNLKSFLAKHIKKIVDSDEGMHGKKSDFEAETKLASEKVLQNSKLSNFLAQIKKNYSINLRNNNCEVIFGLPEYEDIFLQMMFKIGLNGNAENLLPISHFGDGYISMFVMAVIQAIAEENTEDKCLFLFEEPESFLHENHQEYFYKMVLCSLSEKGHQVIYTTHSDKMVDIFVTKGLIRLEYDEGAKQTLKKYNNIGDFNTQEVVDLASYNSFIKTIEPNLNKILFSRKVMLVEGPNDVMAYKYVISKKIESLGCSQKFAETYLNFHNISIVPHHGKSTALLLIEVCKHFGLEYFAVNDWDFEHDFSHELEWFRSLEALKSDQLYLTEDGHDRTQVRKGMVTTNWNLLWNAGRERIHFNVPKLEAVLGYHSNDKDSLKIWTRLNQIHEFGPEIFPPALEEFLELDKIEVPEEEEVLQVEDEDFFGFLEEDELPF